MITGIITSMLDDYRYYKEKGSRWKEKRKGGVCMLIFTHVQARPAKKVILEQRASSWTFVGKCVPDKGTASSQVCTAQRCWFKIFKFKKRKPVWWGKSAGWRRRRDDVRGCWGTRKLPWSWWNLKWQGVPRPHLHSSTSPALYEIQYKKTHSHMKQNLRKIQNQLLEEKL